jgi:hypothetical protein
MVCIRNCVSGVRQARYMSHRMANRMTPSFQTSLHELDRKYGVGCIDTVFKVAWEFDGTTRRSTDEHSNLLPHVESREKTKAVYHLTRRRHAPVTSNPCWWSHPCNDVL